MKRTTASVCTAILLLGFFVCGQWFAFSHFHPPKTSDKNSTQIVTEKCQVCDQLISFDAVLAPTSFFIEQQPAYLSWLEPVFTYSFSAFTEGSSRAPPLA